MKTLNKILFYIKFTYNKHFYNPHKRYTTWITNKEGKKVKVKVSSYIPMTMLGKTIEERTKYYKEFRRKNG
jgi:hypothetical protein